MENFEELQKLLAERNKLYEYAKRIKTISAPFNQKHAIIISDNYNDRYTFSGIASIIGEDKFEAILRQFEGLINVELQIAKEINEDLISCFKVLKNESAN